MKKYATLVIALAGTLTAGAQLSAEIDVERTVVPRLELHKPLASMMPSVVQGSDGKMRLSLSEYSGGAVPFIPSPVEGGMPVFSGLPAASPYRGYVWGGYLPVYNAGAGAGYRFIDNANSQVEAAARFSGNSYSNNIDDEKSTAGNNTIGLHAGARHTFAGNTTVHANADYSFSALNLPGQIWSFNKLKMNRLRAEGGVCGETKRTSYLAEAFIDYFGTRNPVYKLDNIIRNGHIANVFGIRGEFDGALRDSTAGYWLKMNLTYKYRRGMLYNESSQRYNDGTHGCLIMLQPGFRLHRSTYKAEIALSVEFCNNLDGSAMRYTPQARLAWIPSGQLSVYGYTSGGTTLAVQNHVYDYSPFAAGRILYGDMFTLYDARIGAAFGPVQGVSVDIYGRAASTRRAPMISSWGRNDVFLEPTDVSGFAAGIDVDWQHARGHARAGFQAMQHSGAHAFADAPDRPGYMAYISADARVTDRIGIYAGWNFRGGRRYYGLSGAESLGNISNVNIGGSYRFDSRLTFTLTLDNILFRRALILPGLRQAPITGLIAATYLF